MNEREILGVPELAEAIERIRVMEASAFWKLRNRWHDLKARLRLSNGAMATFPIEPGPARSPESRPGPAPSPDDDYEAWFARRAPRPSDIDRMRNAARSFSQAPQISILVATFETPERYLRSTIESVLGQAYEAWELCIADDGSRDPRVRRMLERFAARDSRIKLTFRAHNGHISQATNTALASATGDYVVFLDHDDMLTADALYEIAQAIVLDPSIDLIYSDEDKIDDTERVRDPHFKPDWSPDSFLSRMYVGHVVAIRRALVEAVGGMRTEFDGSQDYDLLLRVTERTERIHHIPRVLYHWRIHRASTAGEASAKPYAAHAAEKALNDALRRRGERARVAAIPGAPGTFEVRFVIARPDRVSVIVPTRDHGGDVEQCIVAALARTSYPNLEIVILDNGSTDRASLATFAALAGRDPRIRVVRHDVPFNFSAVNNYAVAQTDGRYVLFLNNDTEAAREGWLDAMVAQAQRPRIGAVGALLLYPDESVQHAGVITGLGGVAGHSHKHYPASAPGYYYMLRALTNYSAVTAACMMVRRDVFDAVGGFDESLAVAFNDVDFCLRVGAAGFRNVYVPEAVLYHYESKSRGYETTPEKIERFSAEIAIMKARWPLLARPDPFYNRNLTLDREDFSRAP